MFLYWHFKNANVRNIFLLFCPETYYAISVTTIHRAQYMNQRQNQYGRPALNPFKNWRWERAQVRINHFATLVLFTHRHGVPRASQSSVDSQRNECSKCLRSYVVKNQQVKRVWTPELCCSASQGPIYHSLGWLSPRLPLLAIWKNQHQTELYIPPKCFLWAAEILLPSATRPGIIHPNLLIQVTSGA